MIVIVTATVMDGLVVREKVSDVYFFEVERSVESITNRWMSDSAEIYQEGIFVGNEAVY